MIELTNVTEQIAAFVQSLMSPEFIGVMMATFIVCEAVFKMPRVNDFSDGLKQISAVVIGGLLGLVVPIVSVVPSWVAGAIAGGITTRLVNKISK